MSLKKILLVMAMSVLAMPAMAQVQCRGVFADIILSETEIISKIESLARMTLYIESAQGHGSSSREAFLLKPKLEQKRAQLISYLESHHLMTRQELREKTKEFITKIQSSEQAQETIEITKKQIHKAAEKEAMSPEKLGQVMTFFPILPGKFKMHLRFNDVREEYINVELTEPFEMMATPVTQLMWARIKIALGEKDLDKIAPSFFKTGEGSASMNIEGMDVQIKPRHPVEQVNWDDIQGFIDGLNRLSQSEDAHVQSLLSDWIEGHQKGDIYALPTEYQWEYVRSDRGQFFDPFERSPVDEMSKYAWTSENSGKQTQAVAGLEPRMANDSPFYDLEGNVWEWTKSKGGKLLGGKDPQDNPQAPNGSRVLLGGSSYAPVQNAIGFAMTSDFERVRHSSTGFRLIRRR
jgi:formylglycine-generating enzyme required for sulfatase activity